MAGPENPRSPVGEPIWPNVPFKAFSEADVEAFRAGMFAGCRFDLGESATLVFSLSSKIPSKIDVSLLAFHSPTPASEQVDIVALEIFVKPQLQEITRQALQVYMKMLGARHHLVLADEDHTLIGIPAIVDRHLVIDTWRRLEEIELQRGQLASLPSPYLLILDQAPALVFKIASPAMF